MTPEELHAEYVSALKSRDPHRLAVVRAVLQEVHDQEIRTRGKADETCVETALRRVERTTREERDVRAKALGDEEDRVLMLSEQLAWLESALPQKMGADELTSLVRTAMAEVGCDSMRQMRDVIAYVTDHATASFDNGTVSSIVHSELARKGE